MWARRRAGVDARADARAGREAPAASCAGAGTCSDARRLAAVPCACRRCAITRAVGQPQRAGVAGLAAAERIEHGAVEHDAALVDGQHGGLALAAAWRPRGTVLRSWCSIVVGGQGHAAARCGSVARSAGPPVGQHRARRAAAAVRARAAGTPSASAPAAWTPLSGIGLGRVRAVSHWISVGSAPPQQRRPSRRTRMRQRSGPRGVSRAGRHRLAGVEPMREQPPPRCEDRALGARHPWIRRGAVAARRRCSAGSSSPNQRARPRRRRRGSMAMISR